MPGPLDEYDSLAADVTVPEFFECLHFSRLEIDALFVVIQTRVGKLSTNQSVFKFRTGEADIVGVHVSVTFGDDELDAGDKVEI